MVRILQGDCREVLRTLPSESVHCCVTSPPYFGLRDYGIPGQVWGGDPTCQHEWGEALPGFHPGQVEQTKWKTADAAGKAGNTHSGQFCGKCGAWLGCLGLEPTPELYVSHLVEIFREVRRALRKDGTFWLNLGDSYSGYHGNSRVPDSEAPSNKPGYIENMRKSTVGVSGLKQKDLIGIPWMTAFALRADGWYLRQDIVWAKKNCLPESMTDRCTKSHEYLFLLSKSARYYFDNEAIKEPASGREPGNKTHKHVDSVKRRVAEGDHSERTKLGLATTGAFSFRNKRDVWTTSTRPYKGAHFAVFPTALVEPPILAGTSEKGCCKKCGSPWKRVMETSGGRDWRNDEMIPKGIPGELAGEGSYKRGQSTSPLNDTKTRKTVGWKPTCDCNAGDPVPCTVLDPFGGSGTTGEVAERLGRNSILIELNPSYVELAKRRTIKRVPVLPGDSWKEPVTGV